VSAQVITIEISISSVANQQLQNEINIYKRNARQLTVSVTFSCLAGTEKLWKIIRQLANTKRDENNDFV